MTWFAPLLPCLFLDSISDLIFPRKIYIEKIILTNQILSFHVKNKREKKKKKKKVRTGNLLKLGFNYSICYIQPTNLLIGHA